MHLMYLRTKFKHYGPQVPISFLLIDACLHILLSFDTGHQSENHFAYLGQHFGSRSLYIVLLPFSLLIAIAHRRIAGTFSFSTCFGF